MATTAEFDDMNATPLGKLPMPAVQSKGDAPRVDMGTSYTDILKEMSKSRDAPQAPPQAAAPQLPPRPQQMHPQQMHPQMHLQPHDERPDAAEFVPREGFYVPQRPPPQPHVAARPPSMGRHKRSRGAWDKVREYRTSLLVAGIVFVLLWYIAPKLAAAAPQLLTASGRFNLAGLAIIAAMAGGIHRVVDHYAPV